MSEVNLSSELDTKKFVWAYLVKNGVETDGEWNYYGGGFRLANQKLEYGYVKYQERQNQIQAHIKSVGVDWDKTRMPESDVHYSFEGTFCDSSRSETLFGVLVLKDGTEYMLGSHDKDGMGSYITNLTKLMKMANLVQDTFGDM
jgi:hypothetical protein